MCYLCMLYNPFGISDDKSTPRYKRQRIIEIKQMISAIEDKKLCNVGNGAYEALREEQYRLSREL